MCRKRYLVEEEDIYPITVVQDKYGGEYSGGEYTAWNLQADEVPHDLYFGVTACCRFWIENPDILVGKGSTAQKAINDLVKKVNEKEFEEL